MSKKVPKFRQQSQPGSSTPATASQPEKTPALVINIHTWATPIVAVVFLIIGLLGGYFLRPALSGDKSTAEVAVQPTVQAVEPTPPLDPVAVQATRDAVMVTLASQAKHFRGDENAPVTMIEFSDFQ
jgi:hypothetical protein